MSRPHVSRIWQWTAAVCCAGLTVLSGCRLLERDRISGTMGYRQQMTEITKIAPYGTLREKTVSRLEQAGVVGEYSRAGKSIYYCNLWNRSDGKRWHMTVALLFNAKGEFYAINLADADVQQGDAAPDGGAEQPPGRARVNPAGPVPRSTSPVPWPQERERTGPAFPGPETTDPRIGRRTPFEDGQR